MILKMPNNEEIIEKIKFLYYEENLTEMEIAALLGKSRQWVSNALNSDALHKEKKKERVKKRIINRKINTNIKATNVRISIPLIFFNEIGINENKQEINIKLEGKKIVIKKKNVY